MTSAVPGLPHLIGLIRSPRGGIAILGAFVLSGLLVIQALAATLVVSTRQPAGRCAEHRLQPGADCYRRHGTLLVGRHRRLASRGPLAAPAAVISGSPSVLANSAFTVRVTDGDGNTATKSLAIKVNPQLTIATTALAAGVSGVAYTSQTLAATGGTGTRTRGP